MTLDVFLQVLIKLSICFLRSNQLGTRLRSYNTNLSLVCGVLPFQCHPSLTISAGAQKLHLRNVPALADIGAPAEGCTCIVTGPTRCAGFSQLLSVMALPAP